MNASNIIALDIGERRIGVASAHIVARIASPLTTLSHTEHIMHDLLDIITKHEAAAIVIGLPRGLDGQHTLQTAYVEHFAHELEQKVTIPLYWQDEAVTSRQAEAELKKRGKAYAKEDIDALAATYILEDFLQSNPELHV